MIPWPGSLPHLVRLCSSCDLAFPTTWPSQRLGLLRLGPSIDMAPLSALAPQVVHSRGDPYVNRPGNRGCFLRCPASGLAASGRAMSTTQQISQRNRAVGAGAG